MPTDVSPGLSAGATADVVDDVVDESATAWVSGSDVIHLDLSCSGLDRMREFGKDPEDTFTRISYTDPTDLVSRWVAGKMTSLCRLCATETVIAAVLAAHPLPDPDDGVFVTFALSRPPDPATKPKATRSTSDDARSRALAIEAEQRMKRIAAAATGLHTTRGVRGSVAYGFLSPRAVDQLCRIVHAVPKYTVRELPEPELVSTFWRMWAEAELAQPQPGGDAPQDPWYLAELICSPPDDRAAARAENTENAGGAAASG